MGSTFYQLGKFKDTYDGILYSIFNCFFFLLHKQAGLPRSPYLGKARATESNVPYFPLKPSTGKVLHAWPASPDLFYRQTVETEVRSLFEVEHHNTTWHNSSERDSVNQQRWPTMAHLIPKDGTDGTATGRALPHALALPI